MTLAERDPMFLANKRVFQEFLEPDYGDTTYSKKISEMVDQKKNV